MPSHETPPAPLLPSTIAHFWDTIPPVWHRVRDNVRLTATQGFGISVEQFHILRHIRRGLQSVSELAEARGISRPAVSQAVDILVEKGLIARTEDPADRRYVRLTLTSAGDALLTEIFAKNRLWMAEQMASLTPHELHTLNQAFEILHTTFGDPD